MPTKIYAVDFDGLITKHSRYPNLGEPNIEMIRWLKKQQEDGVTLILWTCRTNKYGEELLDDAIRFCKAYGLEFDYINENHPEMVQKYGNDSRKVFAHLYIDYCFKTPWEIIEYTPKEKPKLPLRKAKIAR